jgi:hypothetical protein
MILRLDGAKKRSVYQGPGLGVWYALEYPTGRTLAWWEGEEGEREEIGDFPTLEEAYEAIEAHFSRKVDEIVASLDEDEVLGPLFASRSTQRARRARVRSRPGTSTPPMSRRKTGTTMRGHGPYSLAWPWPWRGAAWRGPGC